MWYMIRLIKKVYVTSSSSIRRATFYPTTVGLNQVNGCSTMETLNT